MSIYKGNNAARFTQPLFAARAGQVISLCSRVCICMFACHRACVCVCVSRREGVEKDEAGRFELCSAGVGRAVGWQMPEAFIRLQGGGGCEWHFSGKSIRPKHKHRRASNPGRALHAPLLLLLCCSLLFSIISKPPPPPSNSPIQSAPAHLYSMLLFVPSFSLSPLFLLLPCLSVKRSSH